MKVPLKDLLAESEKKLRDAIEVKDVDAALKLDRSIRGLKGRITVEKKTTKVERREWAKKSVKARTERRKTHKSGPLRGQIDLGGRPAENRCTAYTSRVYSERTGKYKVYPGSHRYPKPPLPQICYGCGHVETPEENEKRMKRSKAYREARLNR